MEWKKLGLVYGPDGSSSWAKHSALQPTPILLGDTIRVYCGFRDNDGVSRVGFVDLDAKDPTSVRRVSRKPSLDTGNALAFDRDGVVPCAVIARGRELYLYYAGYRRGEKVRFQVFGGLAISKDSGETFSRYSTAPVIGPTAEAALFRVLHSIIAEDGKWRAWYGGGSEFRQGKNKTLPVYNIRYMESVNGIEFPPEGTVAVDISGEEHRVGRPYVIRRDNQYLMFFGSGTEDAPYKLTYAVSADGLRWERRSDLVGLSLSKSGWDSEMIAYPSVVSTDEATYMFYNGNNYGKDGFGCARLISW